jgi:two-component system OmpR family sensor kinase
LVAIMIVLVAVGLAAVDIITLSSLHSYLYGRVDDQLSSAGRLMTAFVVRADHRGFTVTSAAIHARVSPEIFVELKTADGQVIVARASGSQNKVDPPPRLPSPLPIQTSVASGSGGRSGQAYHPSSASIDVPAVGAGPEYRLQAISLPGETLIVASPLDSVNATLNSLRTIELAVSLGLLVTLLILMTVLVRLGLRPLEDMTKEADAIAAGDLSRRVRPAEGNGEIARLGRAFNGMLTQIETAFALRARSEERLRSFLADASHELRTPLTSIRGYAELLQKDALTDKADRDRALSRIEKEAARMGLLVGDLAILAREGEGPEPTRYRVNLAAVAADAVADARTVDVARSIELHAPTEVPVAGDDARLEQMMHNLVDNALTHTPAGTPVEVSVMAQGPSAVLEVRDEGPGLTAEQAGQVFDRFYRGDADRLDGGSGLGLFIVASLARTFGGTAEVDTVVGQGSTFRVVLPLWTDEQPEDGPEAEAVRGPGPDEQSRPEEAPGPDPDGLGGGVAAHPGAGMA